MMCPTVGKRESTGQGRTETGSWESHKIAHQRRRLHGHWDDKSRTCECKVQPMKEAKDCKERCKSMLCSTPGTHSKSPAEAWWRYMARKEHHKAATRPSANPSPSPWRLKGWQGKPKVYRAASGPPLNWKEYSTRSSQTEPWTTGMEWLNRKWRHTRWLWSQAATTWNPKWESPIPMPPIPEHNSLTLKFNGAGASGICTTLDSGVSFMMTGSTCTTSTK